MEGERKKDRSLLKAVLILLAVGFLVYALYCLVLRIGNCFPEESVGLVEEILS